MALRAYELSKLRYYYAIAECDCANTADKLYQELDGLELEHSSVALDLRMVPDDVGYERKSIYILDYQCVCLSNELLCDMSIALTNRFCLD